MHSYLQRPFKQNYLYFILYNRTHYKLVRIYWYPPRDTFLEESLTAAFFIDQGARQRSTCVNLPPKAKRMKIQTIDFHTKYRNMCNSMRIEVALGWLFGYWARRIENRWERSPGVATEPEVGRPSIRWTDDIVRFGGGCKWRVYWGVLRVRH